MCCDRWGREGGGGAAVCEEGGGVAVCREREYLCTCMLARIRVLIGAHCPGGEGLRADSQREHSALHVMFEWKESSDFWCACLLAALLTPQVLTGQSLATFSLVDCCQSLLDLTLEVGAGGLGAFIACFQIRLCYFQPPTGKAPHRLPLR